MWFRSLNWLGWGNANVLNAFFARKCLGFEDQKGLGNLCETGVQLIWPKQLADAVGKIPCFALHTCPWSQEFFTPESAGLKGGVFVCRLCLHIISWKASSKKDWLWALHGSYMLAFAVSILMLYSSKALGVLLVLVDAWLSKCEAVPLISIDWCHTFRTEIPWNFHCPLVFYLFFCEARGPFIWTSHVQKLWRLHLSLVLLSVRIWGRYRCLVPCHL